MADLLLSGYLSLRYRRLVHPQRPAYAAQGALLPVWPQLAALAPVVLAGIVLGEALHHRVDEHRFRQVLFVVLLLAGIALVF